MAVLNISGAETGNYAELLSYQDNMGFGGMVQSGTKRSGDYAYYVDCANQMGAGGTAVWFRLGQIGADGTHSDFAAATTYVRFYVRFASLTNSGDEDIICFRAGGSVKASFALTSGGLLRYYTGARGTLVATGSTALSVDTWYLVECRVGTGAGAVYDLKLDGATELSGTATVSSTGTAHVQFGTSRSSNYYAAYYDDILVDDAAWPGPGACKRLAANASGSYAQWSTDDGYGGTATDWQCVDETPVGTSPDDLIYTGTTGNAHTFGVQDVDGLIFGPPNATKVTAFVRSDTGGTAGCRVRLRSGSTDSDTTGATWPTGAGVLVCNLRTGDPATGSAWTPGGLNAAQVGVYSVTGNTNTVRCSAIYLMVDYPEGAPGTPTGLTAAAQSTGGILLSWSNPTWYEGIKLERSTDNATWTQFSTSTRAPSTITASGPIPAPTTPATPARCRPPRRPCSPPTRTGTISTTVPSAPPGPPTAPPPFRGTGTRPADTSIPRARPGPTRRP